MKYTSKQPVSIVGIGEILWDMLPGGKRIGGAPANFALHAHALGAQAQIISSIGQDKHGREIVQQLSHKQIEMEHIQYKREHPTGRVDVQVGDNGQPKYMIHEDVAWDHIQFSPEMKVLAEKCDAVCFGSLAQRNPVSRSSIQEFLANTKTCCLRIFDINLRQDYYSKEIIESSLLTANVLKLNDDELVVLQALIDLPINTESALKALLIRYQLDFLAFTQGASGSIMMDKNNNISHCPGISVNIKDTVGAGDSFTAAMIMGKLSGLALAKINLLANKVAAFVCSQAGATPALPACLTSELTEQIPVPIRKMVDHLPAQKTKKSDFGKTKQSAL